MTAATARNGRRSAILCADDYGLSAGVSKGIRELAERERLSAASAIVTLDRWPQDAQALRALRDRLAIGLHINLTLGAPLGSMPRLAPGGHLPTLGPLLAKALLRQIDRDEIVAEVARQLARFESELGFPPDHIDGHQHVHVLPTVRDGVLAALAGRFPRGGPLVRVPTDSPSRLLRQRSAAAKALSISALSTGFGSAARAHGFTLNTGFAGVSSFDRRKPYATELTRSLSGTGGRHLIMCHPGHVDAAISETDPIAARRQDEYDAIACHADLPSLLWRPVRPKDGPPVDWEQELGA